jgi:hypothetical protein
MSAFQSFGVWSRFLRPPQNDPGKKISRNCRFKTRKRPLQSAARASKRAKSKTMVTACKHPRVRIVSRHEDAEYVECLECGDVFDSEEFHDMAIEESAEKEEEKQDE